MNWIAPDTTVVDLLTALTTPTIAAFGGYIAWRQWKTNSDNLRERLFERRLAVYDLISDALVQIVRDGSVRKNRDGEMPVLYLLQQAWRDSWFLFDKDISDYIKTLLDRSIDLNLHEEMTLPEYRDENFHEHVKLKGNDLEFFFRQSDVLAQYFSPYLRFSSH